VAIDITKRNSDIYIYNFVYKCKKLTNLSHWACRHLQQF